MCAVESEVWSERWQLAALKRVDMMKLLSISAIIAMVYVLFHIQGNTTDIRVYSRSAFLWMVEWWNHSSGDFSHGWLIPFVSIGVLWWKREEIATATKTVSFMGLCCFVMALLMHWLGVKSQQTRLSLLALMLIFWSIPFYFCGWQVAKLLIFPCAYLFFCIPLSFLDGMTFPLRMLVTVVATELLNGLGIVAQRTGSAIYAEGFSFDVAAPCSGLRSLLAMTALTAIYAFITQKSLIKKWVLFVSSIPLAIIGNVARITTIALVAQAFGEKLALGIYHDYSGYIFFSVAIGLMVAWGGLLNTDYSEVFKRWKQDISNTVS